MRLPLRTALSVAAIVCALPAAAATPRETLLRAAFATPSKAQALAMVQDALDQTNAILAKTPGDKEARLQQALATGYRGQLKRSAGDAKAARDLLTPLARANPRDAEIQLALAGWHLTAVSDLGSFLARTILGANKDVGLAAMDRALALGGNRAFFPAYAALIRIRLDPTDTKSALTFADRAATDPAPTPTDRVLQRAAARVAVPLRAGNGKAAAALAKQVLPFGMVA